MSAEGPCALLAGSTLARSFGIAGAHQFSPVDGPPDTDRAVLAATTDEPLPVRQHSCRLLTFVFFFRDLGVSKTTGAAM